MLQKFSSRVATCVVYTASSRFCRRVHTQHFAGIGKIKFEGSDTSNALAFRYYNPDEVILGKKMKDWLRFSVCFWHTFRGTGRDVFGDETMIRPWDDGSNTMENARRRIDAAFEFMKKLQVEFYTFHDRDIAPVGDTLKATNDNLDAIAEYLAQKQRESNISLLWGTANLFSHWRYACGAATNPNAHVFACAAAQVKKAMEITHRLGGQNFVFWGGREGYSTLLNTNIRRELDHMARFLHMVVEYKQSLGATFQLLLEPKPREPMKHQYDYDAQTTIGFLRHYELEQHFKLNIEPNHTTLAGHSYEHDIVVASQYGFLGSIDANTGDELLGWDTDQFPMDVRNATAVMWTVLEQGGLAPGGLNFDAKVRRESTDLDDMFIAHIGAMDTFAKALRAAAKMHSDGTLAKWRSARYSSFDSGIGAKIEAGQTSLQELERFALENGEPARISGKQEKFERLLQTYL